MNAERLVYRLPFNNFDVVFSVDMARSIALSKLSFPEVVDYFSAEADVWLENDKGGFLVSPAWDICNFFVELRSLEIASRNPPVVDMSKAYFKAGNWHKCIKEYWHRLCNDMQNADDETIYDEVRIYAQLLSNYGDIACYEYNGEHFIEVISQTPNNRNDFIHCHSNFTPEKLSMDLHIIRTDILKRLLPYKMKSLEKLQTTRNFLP